MNCKVIGYDLKSLLVELDPSEKFYCEKGAIIYHEGGIEKDINVLGQGLGGMLKRKLSGESIFMVHLTNKVNIPRKLMVAGKLGMLPVNMSDFNGQIISRGGYYIASTKDVNIDFKLNITSWIGGTGLILQRISGDGTVFLDSFGSPYRLEVPANDSVIVDEKSFICVDGRSESQIEANFSGKGLLGGEGLTMMKINGPATVYVNTVNTH